MYFQITCGVELYFLPIIEKKGITFQTLNRACIKKVNGVHAIFMLTLNGRVLMLVQVRT